MVVLRDVRGRQEGGEGSACLGYVCGGGQRVMSITGRYADFELSLEACSSVALPWSFERANDMERPSKNLVEDVNALIKIAEAFATFEASWSLEERQLLHLKSGEARVATKHAERLQQRADEAMREGEIEDAADAFTISEIAKSRHQVEESNERVARAALSAARATLTTLESVYSEPLKSTVAALPALSTLDETCMAIDRKLSRLGQGRSAGDALELVADAEEIHSQAGKLRRAVDSLDLEALAAAALRRIGTFGRRYGSQQQLVIWPDEGHRHTGRWVEVQVVEARSGGNHLLRDLGAEDNRSDFVLRLTPWNHAPKELPRIVFEAEWEWHRKMMNRLHGTIVESLSGRRLDVLDNCIRVELGVISARVDENSSGRKRPVGDFATIETVDDLWRWLCVQHKQWSRCGATRKPPENWSAVLITAGTAAGKSVAMKALAVHAASVPATTSRATGPGLLPIFIGVEELLEGRKFPNSLNWVDGYFRSVHVEGSDYCRFLRQAIMARRVLLLIDGVDQGGDAWDMSARHITEVLAPQGHAVVVASRELDPSQLRRFDSFQRLTVLPLTEAKQAEAIEQRLGAACDADALVRVGRMPMWVPIDAQSKQFGMSNPLILSTLIASVEIDSTVTANSSTRLDALTCRAGLSTAPPFPMTTPPLPLSSPPSESLYEAAVTAMLRTCVGETLSATVSSLLERIFIDVHAREQSIISTEHIRRAAHELGSDSASSAGAADGALVAAATRALCNLAQQGRMPLLSLVRVLPRHYEASHCSFQEFYAARAICHGLLGTTRDRLLPSTPPWRWGGWWANVLAFGMQMGEAFEQGLLKAAGVEYHLINHEFVSFLDLQGIIVGEEPRKVALLAVAILLRAVTSAILTNNELQDEDALLLARAIRGSRTLTRLDLQDNRIVVEGARSLGLALCDNRSVLELRIDSETALPVQQLSGESPIESLDLSARRLGIASAVVIAKLVARNRTLLNLCLLGNINIGPTGGEALADCLSMNSSLRSLDLYGCRLGDRGGRAIAKALRVNKVLALLEIQMNGIKEAAADLLDAVRQRHSFELLHAIQQEGAPPPQHRLAPQFANQRRSPRAAKSTQRRG